MWPFKPDLRKLAARGNVRGLTSVLCSSRAHPVDRIWASLALAAIGTDDVDHRCKTLLEGGIRKVQEYFDALEQYWTKVRPSENFNRVSNAATSAALALSTLFVMDKYRLSGPDNPIARQIERYATSSIESEFLVGTGVMMLSRRDMDHKLVAKSLCRYRWDRMLELDRKIRILIELAFLPRFGYRDECALTLLVRVFLDGLLMFKHAVPQFAEVAWTLIGLEDRFERFHSVLLEIAPKLWKYDLPVGEHYRNEVSLAFAALMEMDRKWVNDVRDNAARRATTALLEWVRRNRRIVGKPTWCQSQIPKKKQASGMAEIVVSCSKCRRAYRLGADAAVVTTEGVASDFAVVTWLGKPRSGTEDDPDLIAACPPGYSPTGYTMMEIARLQLVRATRTPRWWRCDACKTVNPYPWGR